MVPVTEPVPRVRVDPDPRVVVPVIEADPARVRFELTLRTVLPVIDLLVAKLRAATLVPSPIVTVEALIDSLAVIVEAPETLTAARPLVEPRVVPEAMVLVAVRFTVPRLAADPSTAPVIVPDPIVKIEPEFKVIAVASRLLDPAVRVFEAARVIALKDPPLVPTFPARVLLSVKAAVPTPSDAP